MQLEVRKMVEALSGEADPVDPWRADDSDSANDRLVISTDWRARESEAMLGAMGTSLHPSQIQ